jgi:NTP pyrophosphatase (non-canonical NTP hydrolase)
MDNKARETLLILQEECAEVTQAISKIFRFGMDSYHPESGISNHESLVNELGDLLAMIDIVLEDSSLNITQDQLDSAKQKKFQKLTKWSSLRIIGD